MRQRTENEIRAEHHQTRRLKSPPKMPGREVEFVEADGKTKHVGSFWAHAPGTAFWLVVDGRYVLVSRMTLTERRWWAEQAGTEYIERKRELS
jgi:hypothetical protein